jgi:ribosomal protein L12E/L44/L45/RPP1/RPP2
MLVGSLMFGAAAFAKVVQSSAGARAAREEGRAAETGATHDNERVEAHADLFSLKSKLDF